MVWREIVIISDDGRSEPSDYDELSAIGFELARTYPSGIALLSIIPENAVPPPDDVRAAINQALQRVEGTLRCVSWCVEGSGFQAAMVRAVLAGFHFLSSASYERHVGTSLQESLAWILPHLRDGRMHRAEVDEAVAYIRRRRESLRAVETFGQK